MGLAVIEIQTMQAQTSEAQIPYKECKEWE